MTSFSFVSLLRQSYFFIKIAHVKLTSELYYILYTILYLLISMNLSIIWAAFVCGFVNIFCDVKKISKLIFWILKRKLLLGRLG